MTDISSEEKKTSVKVLRDFFGYRDGDSLRDFGEELKKLSFEDKEQLTKGIIEGSLTY
jgi:hypothetical protein